MKNLAKAVIAVMKEVKGIEKDLNVGTGTSSYKGVGDQQVKKIVGDAMAKNGLCIMPISINSKTHIDRYEETNQYGTKMKQSVLTEVETKYLLLHESGESLEIAGYGHGTDSQDKSAGKATTYALKYTLLYTFLIPTGKIDDADNVHSDDIPLPKKSSLPVGELSAKISSILSVDALNDYYAEIGKPTTPAILDLFKSRKVEILKTTI